MFAYCILATIHAFSEANGAKNDTASDPVRSRHLLPVLGRDGDKLGASHVHRKLAIVTPVVDGNGQILMDAHDTKLLLFIAQRLDRQGAAVALAVKQC
jgi:hypothetical protein